MKPIPAEDARLRGAFEAIAEGAASLPGCPEPERLWNAVAGELPSEEVRELVDHTASCPSCAEAWRLARELDRRASGEQPNLGTAPATSRASWRWSTAAAAAVVLALVGVQLWRVEPTSTPAARFRDSASENLRSLLVDGAALPREAFHLRWSSETGVARRFDVWVATEDLRVIAQARGVEEPEYVVPEAALEQLATGERILWQVEAVFDDGSRDVSPTFVNRLE